jgi:replication-associated recombination protein RarA
MDLYEKYRPRTFEDVIGQDKAIRTIERLLSKQWGGQAFWISGASGTGKTTLARIIANIGADDFFVHEYDSADVLTMEELDEVARTMHLYGFGEGKTGRAYIVNEAHGLRSCTLRRLLGMLERIPSHTLWVFTTTQEGQTDLFEGHIDASPLVSRCHEIKLTNQGLCRPFAARVQGIARAEGLDGKPPAAYETLAKECRNNMRRMLQAVADGRMIES